MTNRANTMAAMLAWWMGLVHGAGLGADAGARAGAGAAHVQVHTPTVFPVGWFSSASMGTHESFPPAPFNVVVKYWNVNPPDNSTTDVVAYLEQARPCCPFLLVVFVQHVFVE